uniref:Uncharacterized protein n=1 Tax=Pseudo-nitzschia australis TaxID=44445 RepID=A0A7S4ARF1_9STRA
MRTVGVVPSWHVTCSLVRSFVRSLLTPRLVSCARALGRTPIDRPTNQPMHPSNPPFVSCFCWMNEWTHGRMDAWMNGSRIKKSTNQPTNPTHTGRSDLFRFDPNRCVVFVL